MKKLILALAIALSIVFLGYKLAEAAVEMTVSAVVESNPPMRLWLTCDDVRSGALIELNGSFCEPMLEVTTNSGSQLETVNPQIVGLNK